MIGRAEWSRIPCISRLSARSSWLDCSIWSSINSRMSGLNNFELSGFAGTGLEMSSGRQTLAWDDMVVVLMIR